ncbi:S8 family serine peptidase [Patescibacteria group bacterium]|nr:S8 family serine peptidase [Patescibacteria group bacterium]MBU4455171.1 S8 family serine peptidase [Patescibacteria group bacterium]
MNRKIAFFLIYFLCFAVASADFLFFSANSAESEKLNTDKIRKADEILVKFKGDDEINVIKIAQSEDFYQILDFYNNHEAVEYAEPNYLYHAAIIPSDTYYSNQWYLQKIKAPDAWDKVREAPDIVIAILDSGVQINHPDLRDNIWKNKDEIAANGVDDDKNGFIDDINGWDFVDNTADPNPKFAEGFTESGILHGTVVAGVAAASGNNAAGVTGIAWKAGIMPLKVLDDKGEGNTGDVVKAVDYAITNGADIINLSFVGFGFSQGLHNAIKRAYDAGVIVVAAGGNELEGGEGHFLDNAPMYPVCHDGDGENRVIGVAATDTLDQKANFSGYGSKCIDIAAPGLSVFSTVAYAPDQYIDGKSFDKYYDGYWSGTSVAVPMVSAAIALVEKANPKFNRGQIVSALLDNADNINKLNPEYLNQLGKGRLNIAKAVDSAAAALNKNIVELIISPYSNYKSVVKISDQDGNAANEFFSYSEGFLGGVNVAGGDVNGDGVDEIITGAGAGGGPHVRIFNSQGELLGQFFAYDAKFRGGVNVASGDVNGDGVDEIITGAGAGGGPHIRIFNSQGELLGQFFAYDAKFRGGVNVASGDVNGDGVDEIIAGAGPGGGPHVRIFKADGRAIGQFFAYDAKFRGGVNVATADVDGGIRDKKAEIIAAPGKGGGPHVRIFNDHGKILNQFFAYNNNFLGGVNVAGGDVDGDGVDEIITGAGAGGGPHVRVFEINGVIIGSFYAFAPEFSGGVNVAAIRITK